MKIDKRNTNHSFPVLDLNFFYTSYIVFYTRRDNVEIKCPVSQHGPKLITPSLRHFSPCIVLLVINFTIETLEKSV